MFSSITFATICLFAPSNEIANCRTLMIFAYVPLGHSVEACKASRAAAWAHIEKELPGYVVSRVRCEIVVAGKA